VHHGLPLVVMTPQAFGRDPLLWPRAMSHFGASSTVAPNFAYDLVASRATPEFVATLDLKAWSIAMNGAEPVLPATLDRFTRVFAAAGFEGRSHCPVYGLAEGTLVVTGKTLGKDSVFGHFDRSALAAGRVLETTPGPQSLAMASSGEVLGDQRLIVVDPDTRRLCAADVVGELWLAGGSVARGYWENRALTQEVFRATMLPTGEGPFLRTGDLGFLHEGQLFVTGRLKDLIIIAGKNHYPQDLEITMRAAHPALATGAGAAFSIDGMQGEELTLVCEVGLDYRNADFATVESAVRQAVVREHELAVVYCVFVKLATLPKTSSGKIRRHRCRAQFVAGELKAHHHSGEVRLRDAAARSEPVPLALPAAAQQRLIAMVARVLETEVTELDLDRPLLEQGLSSLRATELQEELQTGFEISIDYEDFFEPWTVRRIAEIMATKQPPSAR
jgi:acyl-CoA synthetase (AMP-forming)/AMP-acid ligase II/aryl carrier-like protein